MGHSWPQGAEEGGGRRGRGEGWVHGERSTEQAVTHICFRRKTSGLRKSPGYESRILPIPVASVRFQFKIQDCNQRPNSRT
jgi:hypothetical protein